MSRKIEAPWTEEQVQNLRDWQADGWVHSFFGENKKGKHVVLIPTANGWVAERGGPVVQTWAWDFMLDGSVLRRVKEAFGDEQEIA